MSEVVSKNPTPPINPPVADAPPDPTVQVTIWFDALTHSPLPVPDAREVRETVERRNDVPLTSNFPAGAEVPIPTLPSTIKPLLGAVSEE